MILGAMVAKSPGECRGFISPLYELPIQSALDF